MKTLYLHIGTPKTATTAIQFFCRDNQELLNRQGYFYPVFEWKYPNVLRTRNAHFLVGDTYLSQEERSLEEEEKVFQEAFGQIYEAFEQYDGVILSDESMWNHGFRACPTKEALSNFLTVIFSFPTTAAIFSNVP